MVDTAAMAAAPEKAAPLISVIIPCYRSAGTIAAALQSLAAQRAAPPFEAIVVESSGDGAAEIVARDFAWARLIRLSRRTRAARARNLGAAEARGALLVFLDSDCVAEPDWLARMTLLFAPESSCGLGGPVANGNPHSVVSWAGYLLEFSDFLPSGPPRPVPHIPSGNLLVARRSFEAVGGFPEGFRFAQEDRLFSHLLTRQTGLPFLFHPDIPVRHWQRESLTAFLRHQYRIGRGGAEFLKIAPGRGARFARSPRLVLLIAPLLPFVKWSRCLGRLLRWRPGLLARHPALAVLMLLGMFRWSAGFTARARWRSGGASRPPGPGEGVSRFARWRREVARIQPICWDRGRQGAAFLADPAFWEQLYFSRRLSIWITCLLQNAPITPNQVTAFWVLLGAVGAGLLAAPGHAVGAVGAALLWIAWILDNVDGELARLRQTFSVRGDLLDMLGHQLHPPLIFAALTFHETRAGGETPLIIAGLAATVLSGPVMKMRDNVLLLALLHRRKGAAAPHVFPESGPESHSGETPEPAPEWTSGERPEPPPELLPEPMPGVAPEPRSELKKDMPSAGGPGFSATALLDPRALLGALLTDVSMLYLLIPAALFDWRAGYLCFFGLGLSLALIPKLRARGRELDEMTARPDQWRRRVRPEWLDGDGGPGS